MRKSNGDVLSGGERRRTEIARALAVDPKFILLDEPFAGIDPIAVEDIQAIVAKLKYKNIGILITDHNVTETLSICDRAYLLIEGKIFKHGTAEELAADEQVKRLYLGRNFELKRKDYLYDELHNVPTVENLIRSLESARLRFFEIEQINNDAVGLIGQNRMSREEYRENSNDLDKTIQEIVRTVENFPDHVKQPSLTLEIQKTFRWRL